RAAPLGGLIMRSDVHLFALRAAAKVAFSMALPVAMLSGCSSADNQNNDGTSPTDEETAANEEAIKSGKKKPPCHEDAAAPKPSCDSVLASAFPGPDKYQWEPVAQSKEVVACCDKELTEKGVGSPHRWACCVAYDPTVDAGSGGFRSFSSHGMACTPWGPPVP